MNCDYGKARLDDYFDHALDAGAQTLFLAHCRQCAECRAAVDAHTSYLLMLKAFKLSAPAAPVKRLDAQRVQASSKPRASAVAPWFMRVAAACGAVAVGLGWYAARDTAPAAVADDDMWSKVNIVIQVPAALDDARLTVSLPPGISLPGYEGVQTIAWETDLAQGTNALELPLRIDSETFDRSLPQYLDATLEYQGASKSFEFLVDLDEAVASAF